MTEVSTEHLYHSLEFNPEASKFQSAFTDSCKPENSKILDTYEQDFIEVVTKLPDETFTPTRKFLDITVHFNDQRNDKVLNGLNFHPVHPSCEIECPFLDEKLVRLHAFISETGHKIIYAEELPFPSYSRWESFSRDVEGIFMAQQLGRFQAIQDEYL